MGHNINRSSGDAPNITDERAPEKTNARKSYEKPQVVYRAPLEAMAVACAPAPPSKSNPGVCPSGPISS